MTDAVPALFVGLCDDAALFPPARTPLPAAVLAHLDHQRSSHAGLVGPFVVDAARLDALGALVPPGQILPISVTFPDGPDAVATVLDAATRLPVDVRAIEVALPTTVGVPEVFGALGRVSLDHPRVDVYVEVPRDHRRDDVLAGCAAHRVRAKFRTGGTTADLYPDAAELAESVLAAVAAGVAFKATAGLHHAVRNTDPATGFDQHGFLNLLLAVDAARDGAGPGEVARTLGRRDDAGIAAAVSSLSERQVAATRARFVSFGTCSISVPLAELTALGLLPWARLDPEPVPT